MNSKMLNLNARLVCLNYSIHIDSSLVVVKAFKEFCITTLQRCNVYEIVCFGLGNFSSCRISRTQLASLLEIGKVAKFNLLFAFVWYLSISRFLNILDFRGTMFCFWSGFLWKRKGRSGTLQTDCFKRKPGEFEVNLHLVTF